jgi:hypothetical protein
VRAREQHVGDYVEHQPDRCLLLEGDAIAGSTLGRALEPAPTYFAIVRTIA